MLGNRLEISKIISLGIQMIKVLKLLHEKYIIHNDIKPSNICWRKFKNGILDEKNSFFLIDFGYAKPFTYNNIYDIKKVNNLFSSLKNYNIRVDNSYQGTAKFMAIQKSEGYEPSPKTDLE